MVKIVLIGAGSAVFGLGTVSDVFQSSVLEGATITLLDIKAISPHINIKSLLLIFLYTLIKHLAVPLI